MIDVRSGRPIMAAIAIVMIIFYINAYRSESMSDYMEKIRTSTEYYTSKLQHDGSHLEGEMVPGMNVTNITLPTGPTFEDQYNERLNDIMNQTLGFQEITMISLPSRTDRQDARVVSAALTGFKFKIVDGVDGNAVDEKALPYTMEITRNEVGCWRAHLNVLRDMVQRGVSTALVLEDDIDWDVSLKAQMTQLGYGSRFITDTPQDVIPHSPYGQGWDLLWVGHCKSNFSPNNPRRWVIPNDWSAKSWMDYSFGNPDMTQYNPHTRVIFETNQGCCTAGYAITLQGAQKALLAFSMNPFNKPIDLGLEEKCWSDDNFKCISTYPSILGYYRPPGNSSKHSDIKTAEDQWKEVKTEGWSENVVFSNRLNIERIMAGQKVFTSSDPNVGPEMSWEEIISPMGYGEFVGQDYVEETVEPVYEESPTTFVGEELSV